MTQERGPRLERFLEQAARRFSGALHPLEILERVRTEAMAASRNGAAANMITIAFHPSDYDRYEGSIARLREEIEAMLDDEERAARLRRVEDRIIGFESRETVAMGIPDVRVTFADTRHRDFAAPPAGATRRLTRHRDVALVLSDGTRAAVTHTPFTIGRGPGNDLVLPSLAVSRQHAEITRSEDGFYIRDLGSRNGIVVNDARMESGRLEPGTLLKLGDIELRLEAAE